MSVSRAVSKIYPQGGQEQFSSTSLSSDHIAYGNGVYVSGTYYGSWGMWALTVSSNGSTWSSYYASYQSTSPSSLLTFCNGWFWIIPSNGGTVCRSSDGANWVSVGSIGSSSYWCSITYAFGNYYVGGNFGNRYAISTDDGSTWTDVIGQDAYDFSYDEDNQVLVKGHFNQISYSTDGSTWSAATVPVASINYCQTVFGNGLFLFFDQDSGGTQYYTSPDGINWTARSVPYISGESLFSSSSDRKSCFYDKKLGLFVLSVKNSTPNGRIYSSSDGITWKVQSSFGYSGSLPSKVSSAYNEDSSQLMQTPANRNYINTSLLFSEWTCPAGVTEVIINIIDIYGTKKGISRNIQVVPNTTYTITVNNQSHVINNPNSFGNSFYWTGSGNIEIVWVE